MSPKPSGVLRIAIQKSGRLASTTLALLRECGINFSYGNGALKSVATDFSRAEILFLRQDDIPKFIKEGVADIGIVGEDVYLESGVDLGTYVSFNIGTCTRCISYPVGEHFEKVEDFEGKRIATCYPVILNGYLAESNVKAHVVPVSPGSVGIATSIGLADAIYDIVVTGTTILANGLKKFSESERQVSTILLKGFDLPDHKAKLFQKLKLRLDSVVSAKESKYIVLNAPKEALRNIATLLPGTKSPTVVELNIPGWIAIHAVIREANFWQIIDDLIDAGATDILVMPIEKMIVSSLSSSK